MDRLQVRVGMRVVFRSLDGEATVGLVLAVRRSRAKVQAIQPRAGFPSGTLFNVPFHLIESEEAPPSAPAPREDG